jgi:hypothetical protein
VTFYQATRHHFLEDISLRSPVAITSNPAQKFYTKCAKICENLACFVHSDTVGTLPGPVCIPILVNCEKQQDESRNNIYCEQYM